MFYEIPEDEWRQEEFLNLSWQPTIAKEFAAIRAILPDDAKQPAYPRMHLRRLSGLWGVTLEQIQQYLQLPDASWRHLAFEETSCIVKNSFAVRFGHSLLYGQQKGGVSETLCLKRHYFPPTLRVETDLLARLAGSSNCGLVSWCQAALFLPDTDDFRKHLQ
jgi:hypothetical protein